jgi:hypothetical protein
MSLYWYVFKFGICHGYRRHSCVADAVFRVWDVLCCKRLGYVVSADVWDHVPCCRRPRGMY